MINEMLVWWDELITKCLPLNPHMSKNLLVRYLKECLLEGKQTPVYVNDPPKKPPIKGMTEPLGSQRVGDENKHLG
jgi:hypothetical protein